MTVAPPSPDTRNDRPRHSRRWVRVVGVVAIALLVAATALWLNRRVVAREALVGWLERQGIPADVQIERIEIDGFVGRIRVGDPRNPDLVVERAEVDYAVSWPWSGGLSVSPAKIRLVRPVLRARWREGRLSLGTLDPLLERFTGRPPSPDATSPDILVQGGRLALMTEYGPVVITGDARLDGGKLSTLDAVLPVVSLKGKGASTEALSGRLTARRTDDRLDVDLQMQAAGVAMETGDGRTATLRLTGQLPYPDMRARRGDGAWQLAGEFSADQLIRGRQTVRGARVSVSASGQVTGWLQDFRLVGPVEARTTYDSLAGPARGGPGQASLSGEVEIARDDAGVRWRADQGQANVRIASLGAAAYAVQDFAASSQSLSAAGRDGDFEIRGPVGFTAGRLATGELDAVDASGQMSLGLVRGGELQISAEGMVKADRGAWPLLGPSTPTDSPDLSAMKQGLRAFAISAPALRFMSGAGGSRMDLLRPATIRPVNGGILTVISAGGRPVFAATGGERGGGAFNITATRGRGLPEAEVSIPRWSRTETGFTATLDGRAALDFDLARGVSIRTRGQLTSGNGRVVYAAAGCADLTIERLELGENDVIGVSGDFCPDGGPLVTIRDGGWVADGNFRGLTADAPFLALRVSGASGQLDAFGGGSGLGLDARVDAATVNDATTPRRFNSTSTSGTARLRDEQWSGAFDIAAGDQRLGGLTLTHDGRSGLGGVIITSESLTFAQGGLQPVDISPLVADLVRPPATGTARFDGRVDWTPDGEGTSSGVLDIPGLDFVSPVGPLRGLRGRLVFTSLTPLVTAPGQLLSVDEITTIAPLTGLALDFALDKAAVTVSGGEVTVGGGMLRVEPFSIPLDPEQRVSGTLVLERVQLGELLSGSGFGDKVQLDAVVSGRIPFTWRQTEGVRVTDGRLAAIQPGRLTIQREALTGLEAGGGGDAVPPNTVQDLAYQAMENLAFDLLDAEVNSLDEGRIGVLFHIRGRHDPPQHQELRLSIAEFVSREFLNRPLPLPSDTGIDLTLDTTLNVNQLIEDILALNRARNGQPDQ